MNKSLLLFGLFSASLFSHACKSAAAADDLKMGREQTIVQNQSANSANIDNAAPQIEKSETNFQTVNFKGVSFNYNPQIFEKVELEDAVEDSPLQQESDKPGEDFPKHTAFHLKCSKLEREATIRILPIEDYRRMYAVSKSLTKFFDERLNALQKILKNEKFRVKDEVPLIPFYDAPQTITARVRHLSFKDGSGIFFLTQYDNDYATFINNEDLTYFYQGISANGKKYVFAQLPAGASFLPKDSRADEFEGYRISYPLSKADVKNYEKYRAEITKRLDNLPADKFEPSLKSFEEIIASLKIEK